MDKLIETAYNKLTSMMFDPIGTGNPVVQALMNGLLLRGSRVSARQIALPFMQEVGRRWSQKHLVVMHEHFASELLRGFLAQQVRDHGRIVVAAQDGVGDRAQTQQPALVIEIRP